MANPRNSRETDIARLRHEKFLTLHVSCSLMIHAVLRHEAIDGRNIETLEFGRRTLPWFTLLDFSMLLRNSTLLEQKRSTKRLCVCFASSHNHRPLSTGRRKPLCRLAMTPHEPSRTKQHNECVAQATKCEKMKDPPQSLDTLNPKGSSLRY